MTRKIHLRRFMENLFIWVGIFIFVACSGDSRYSFVLTGNVIGIKYGKAFILEPETDSILAMANIEQGRFELEGNFDEPGRFIIRVNQRRVDYLLSGKNMELSMDYYGYNKSTDLKGSPANDVAIRYERMLREKSAEREERAALTRDFVKKYPNSIFSAYIADKVKAEDYDLGLEMYNLLSDEVKGSSLGKQLKAHVDALEASGYGKPFPEVRVEAEKEEQFILNNLAGTITVVDFWASWCGPCRQEMQYLKKLHEELEGKGVTFVSISMDNQPDKWLKACKEEQIPWLSVRNSEGFDNKQGICKTLGFKAIPFIVVLDREGRIAGKNLRGQKLRERVLELMQK